MKTAQPKKRSAWRSTIFARYGKPISDELKQWCERGNKYFTIAEAAEHGCIECQNHLSQSSRYNNVQAVVTEMCARKILTKNGHVYSFNE